MEQAPVQSDATRPTKKSTSSKKATLQGHRLESSYWTFTFRLEVRLIYPVDLFLDFAQYAWRMLRVIIVLREINMSPVSSIDRLMESGWKIEQQSESAVVRGLDHSGRESLLSVLSGNEHSSLIAPGAGNVFTVIVDDLKQTRRAATRRYSSISL